MKTSMQGWFLASALAFTTIHVGFAQNGTVERTNAYMALEMYNSNGDAKELEKAKKSIDNAVNDAKAAADPKTWKYMAEIYNKVSFDATLRTKEPTAAIQSYNAYMKALELEVAKLKSKNKPESKIPTKGEYTTGLSETAGGLFNAGADAFAAEKYEDAYNCFNSILQIRPKTAFFTADKPIEFKFKESEAIRLAGVCAVKANKLDEAEKLLMPSLEKGGQFDDEMAISLYRTLANGFYQAGQKDKGKKILADGQKKFPASQELLIAEINFALAEGRLSELEAQLKKATDADPNNVELLFVVGNMYDEIFRKKLETGDASAPDHFAKAIEWYNKALAKDPKHYNSAYSIGVIHVNFSNAYAKKVNAISNTKSPEYKEAQKKYDELLDGAFKYLLEAEKINPKDKGAIIALKALYGVKGDEENFNKYKKMLEDMDK